MIFYYYKNLHVCFFNFFFKYIKKTRIRKQCYFIITKTCMYVFFYTSNLVNTYTHPISYVFNKGIEKKIVIDYQYKLVIELKTSYFCILIEGGN